MVQPPPRFGEINQPDSGTTCLQTITMALHEAMGTISSCHAIHHIFVGWLVVVKKYLKHFMFFSSAANLTSKCHCGCTCKLTISRSVTT